MNAHAHAITLDATDLTPTKRHALQKVRVEDAQRVTIPSEPIVDSHGIVSQNGRKADALPVRTMTRAQVQSRGDDTPSDADFLTALGFQLRLTGGVFIVFALIALIAFGSALAVSGLFFIGIAAVLLGRSARSATRSR